MQQHLNWQNTVQLILVGRSRDKLDKVKNTIEEAGQKAVAVVCDISDIATVKIAAQQIISLQLPIAGMLNNAGIMPVKSNKKCARLGHDICYQSSWRIRVDRSACTASSRWDKCGIYRIRH